MNQETVKAIMNAMQSGKTQREAEQKLGIDRRIISKVAKENGFVPDRIEQNRKGQLRSEKNVERWEQMNKTSVWKNKNKAGSVRVTTSHNYMSISTEPNKFILDAF